jgi:hypothetical protein
MPFGSWGEEWTLDSSLTGIISLDLRELVEPGTESTDLGILLEVMWPNALEVIGSFSDLEIGKSKVAQDPLLVSELLVYQVNLSLNLVGKDLLLLFLEFLVEGELDGRSGDIVNDTQNVIDQCLILEGLAQKFTVVVLLNDVAADCLRLSQLEITVDEVGEVGEGEAKVNLISSEPLLGSSVVLGSELGAGVGQQQTRNLAFAADAPIADSDALINHSDRI